MPDTSTTAPVRVVTEPLPQPLYGPKRVLRDFGGNVHCQRNHRHRLLGHRAGGGHSRCGVGGWTESSSIGLLAFRCLLRQRHSHHHGFLAVPAAAGLLLDDSRNRCRRSVVGASAVGASARSVLRDRRPDIAVGIDRVGHTDHGRITLAHRNGNGWQVFSFISEPIWSKRLPTTR